MRVTEKMSSTSIAPAENIFRNKFIAQYVSSYPYWYRYALPLFRALYMLSWKCVKDARRIATHVWLQFYTHIWLFSFLCFYYLLTYLWLLLPMLLLLWFSFHKTYNVSFFHSHFLQTLIHVCRDTRDISWNVPC